MAFATQVDELRALAESDPSGAAGFRLFVNKRPCDLLTLIITTSVIPAHPTTRLISEVLASHVKHEPALLHCRKIIVCDFPKLSVSGLRHYKSGKIKDEDFARYEEYIAQLEAFSSGEGVYPFIATEVLRLERYRGFAMAVSEALQRVTTPFVMIIQHDRVLVRRFGVENLLDLMQMQRDAIKYIGLCSDTSSGHIHQISSRYNLDITGKVQVLGEEDMGGQSSSLLADSALKRQLIANHPTPLPAMRMLVPLIFWYDSTHIACVQHYRDFVFGSHELIAVPTLAYKWYKLKTGDFIEDKLGQVQREDIKANGLDAAHEKYGTYLLEDNQGPFVRHCHGRMIGTSSKRTYEIYFGDEEVPE